MNHLFDKIFSAKGHVSKEKMKAYLRDELTEKERNEIEQVLENSEFEREALEGFENHMGSAQLLDKLSNKKPEFLKKAPQKAQWPIYTGIAAVGIVLFGIFWLNTPTNTSTNAPLAEHQPLLKEQEVNALDEIQDKKAEEEKPERKKGIEAPITEIEEPISSSSPVVKNKTAAETVKEVKEDLELAKKEVNKSFESTPTSLPEESAVLAESTPVPAKEIAAEDPVTAPNDDMAMAGENDQLDAERPIHHRNLTSSDLNIQYDSTMAGNTDKMFKSNQESVNGIIAKDTDAKRLRDISSSMNSYADKGSFDIYVPQYVLGYKVMNNDYRFTNTKAKHKDGIVVGTRVSSTSPRFESKDSYGYEMTEQEEEEIVKPYDDVLYSGLSKLKNKKYKQSLHYFHAILKAYPTDINALYYGAIAHEKMNDDKTAMEWLDHVIHAQNILFSGEAQWKKALLYEKMKKNEQALELYKVIADSVYHPFQDSAQQKIVGMEKE